MKRAIVFTLDALFAVSILTVFLAAVSLELNVPKETYWLPEMGNNLMTSLDKIGVFTSLIQQSSPQAQATLTAYLSTVPKNINADMTVNIYRWQNGAFVLDKSIHAAYDVISPSQETHIKRVFTDASNNYFGVAELILSYD
jgi:hypothetical protein